MSVNTVDLHGLSKHEYKFFLIWTDETEIQLVNEHAFHPTRKFRFDFANLESKTAFELHGGTWSKGRHTRGKGFETDCEKVLLAMELDWVIIPLTESQINGPTIQRLIKIVETRIATSHDTPH